MMPSSIHNKKSNKAKYEKYFNMMHIVKTKFITMNMTI